MKIDKKIIKELVDYLSEFNLTEIEYQDGAKKVKVGLSELESAMKIVELAYASAQSGESIRV